MFGFGALQRPLHGSRTSEMDPNWPAKSPLWLEVHVTGPLPIYGSQEGSEAKYWQTRPPCQLGQIFRVQKWLVDFYRCSTYSTTCFSSIASLGCTIVSALFWRLVYKAITNFLQKGPFPHAKLAEDLCVDPPTPPGSGTKCWQMAILGPKFSLKGKMGL